MVKCPCCDGNRRIIHPDQQSDPVEGHKLSDRITCPMCAGQGAAAENTRLAFGFQGYRDAIVRWDRLHREEEARRAHSAMQARARALAKLNAADRKALGL